MKILKLNKNNNAEVILEAVTVLKRGGVIVFPTDTVYGLGANACDWRSAEQVFKIKDRPLSKPIPVIVRNMAWAREIAFIPKKLERILLELWPGATTVILPKRSVVPSILTAGEPNVGVRIPNSNFCDKIMGKFGYPLTATSANISGREPTGEINKVINYFKNKLWKPDLVIDAGNLPSSKPSTIVDFSTVKPKILRVGPSKPEQLLKLLKI